MFMRADSPRAVTRSLLVILCLTTLAGVGCQTTCRACRDAETGKSGAAATLAAPVAGYAVVNGEKVPVPEIAMGDEATIRAILDEGMNRNQVMAQLTTLCETFGPRLTGSTDLERAARWARDQFASWGLSNAHLHEWGTVSMRFDRGPSTAAVYRRVERDDGTVTHEKIRDLAGFTTLAWTPGTDGPARGHAVRMPATEEEFEAAKVSLAGAWVVVPPEQAGRRGIRGAPGRVSARYSARVEARQNIAKRADAPPPDAVVGIWTGVVTGEDLGDGLDMRVEITRQDDGSLAGTFTVQDFTAELEGVTFDPATGSLSYRSVSPAGAFTSTWTIAGNTADASSMLADDPDARYHATMTRDTPDRPSLLERVLLAGPLGFVSSSGDERVWTSAAPGWREMTPDKIAQDIEVNVSEPDYDYINSRLYDGVPLDLEFNLPHTFTPGPIPVYNVIAEIPGTEFPDEVIIVSAHLDSWNGPGSLGTTDNGTGSSVTLETARILAAVGAKPKRTIRFILWTGEEQGLLGSRAYVESLTPEQLSKISAVFVDDGGTNYQGGLHAIAPMRDYLAAATAPTNGRFFDSSRDAWMDVNVRIENEMPRGGGSDHAAFNRVGVPGFFWDEIGRANYGHGWHTQYDRLDLAIPEYLVQSSTNSAITAYNLACAPSLLPRAAPPTQEGQQAAAGN